MRFSSVFRDKDRNSRAGMEISGVEEKCRRQSCFVSAISHSCRNTRFRCDSGDKKNGRKTGRRKIKKMVEHFEAFQKSSLHLKTANFPSLKRVANSSSRKILREHCKNLLSVKVKFTHRKSALKRIRTWDFYTVFASCKKLLF